MENKKELKRYQFRIKFIRMNSCPDTPEHEDVFTFIDTDLDHARIQLDWCLNQSELFLTEVVRIVIMKLRG